MSVLVSPSTKAMIDTLRRWRKEHPVADAVLSAVPGLDLIQDPAKTENLVAAIIPVYKNMNKFKSPSLKAGDLISREPRALRSFNIRQDLYEIPEEALKGDFVKDPSNAKLIEGLRKRNVKGDMRVRDPKTRTRGK